MLSFASIPLLLGVVATVAAATKETVQVVDQSALFDAGSQPIASALNSAGKRQLETPEVVLSVKYDGGSIDGIYLAQYRKGKMSALPSVPEGTQLCLDLCHAGPITQYHVCGRKQNCGLGGDGCGASCHALIPVGLLHVTESYNATDHEGEDQAELVAEDTQAVRYGQPRMGVCPSLCYYNLGYPLCGCASHQAASAVVPNWSAICETFCVTDGYTLRGCPQCDVSASHAPLMRILNTVEGWTAWCEVQCRQGQGGAACNCNRTPFSQ